MALRILFLLLGFVIIVNLVLTSVGLIMNVNLYKKYGKQILNFFAIFVIFVIAVYVILSLLGLNG